jgi:uncharacterized membrane protein
MASTHAVTLLVLCLLLGFCNGLRSLTAPAAVCWAAHLGWLNFAGTRFSFLHSRATLIVLTLLAVLELVGDKLPQTPPRTAPLGLVARLVLGSWCGIALAMASGETFLAPAIAGFVGALAGTFSGYNARKALVQLSHLPDFIVALVEDAIAIGGSLLVVSHVL